MVSSENKKFILKCSECGVEVDCSNAMEDWKQIRRKQLAEGYQWHCVQCTLNPIVDRKEDLI